MSRRNEVEITNDRTQEVIDELHNNIVPRFLEELGLFLEGEAKEALENEPRRVDTGLLRNSITYAVSGQEAALKRYHGDKPSKYSKVEAVPIGRYSGTAPNDDEQHMSVYIGSNVEYAA